MTRDDQTRTFYESARAELIARIGHRDNVLVVYLGAVGAIYGLVLGIDDRISILLVIPYLALGAALILSQHHAVIGQIGLYLAQELQPFFESEGHPGPPQWETSDSLRESRPQVMRQLFFGQMLLVVVPAFPALTFTKHLALSPASLFSTFTTGLAPSRVHLLAILWWLSCCCGVGAAWLIISAHCLRRRIYAQYKGKAQPKNGLDAAAAARHVDVEPNEYEDS